MCLVFRATFETGHAAMIRGSTASLVLRLNYSGSGPGLGSYCLFVTIGKVGLLCFGFFTDALSDIHCSLHPSRGDSLPCSRSGWCFRSLRSVSGRGAVDRQRINQKAAAVPKPRSITMRPCNELYSDIVYHSCQALGNGKPLLSAS